MHDDTVMFENEALFSNCASLTFINLIFFWYTKQSGHSPQLETKFINKITKLSHLASQFYVNLECMWMFQFYCQFQSNANVILLINWNNPREDRLTNKQQLSSRRAKGSYII